MSVVRILDVKFTTLHWDLFLKYCSTPPVTPLIDRALVGKAKGRFEYSKWAPFATNQNLQDSGLPSVEREPPNYEIPRENRTIGSRLDEAETMGFFDDDIRDDYA